jgi:hypothetical protein
LTGQQNRFTVHTSQEIAVRVWKPGRQRGTSRTLFEFCGFFFFCLQFWRLEWGTARFAGLRSALSRSSNPFEPPPYVWKQRRRLFKKTTGAVMANSLPLTGATVRRPNQLDAMRAIVALQRQRSIDTFLAQVRGVTHPSFAKGL